MTTLKQKQHKAMKITRKNNIQCRLQWFFTSLNSIHISWMKNCEKVSFPSNPLVQLRLKASCCLRDGIARRCWCLLVGFIREVCRNILTLYMHFTSYPWLLNIVISSKSFLIPFFSLRFKCACDESRRNKKKIVMQSKCSFKASLMNRCNMQFAMENYHDSLKELLNIGSDEIFLLLRFPLLSLNNIHKFYEQ